MSVAVLSGCYDNMYPTGNYNPPCSSGDPGEGYCQTDNADLTYYMQSSLSSTEDGNVYYTMARFSLTTLNTSYDSSPSYSGGSETDIIFQKGTYGIGSGDDAVAWCEDSVSSLKCDQHYVRGLTTTTLHRGLTCHESGHSVGLTHGQQASPQISDQNESLGCLQKSTSSSDSELGDHNSDEINSTY